MDSFAIDGGKVVLQDPVESRAPETSIDGSGATGGPQIGGFAGPRNDFAGIERNAMQSIEAIDKLSQGLLKGYVETAEKVQYHEGMTKVVQGQTLDQIKKDDPWYMNIMGPSATVRGAQAMTATTAIQQAETQMLADMPQDREMSPDQYREKLRQQYLAMGNTGDPIVDMLAQSKFAESNAALAKTHVQQHMAFQQEQMLGNYMNQNLTIADNMKARKHAAIELSPEDSARMDSEAVEAFKPLPGQSRDSWNKASIATLGAALTRGQFDYFNTIRNSDAWNKLDGPAREKLSDHYATAVAQDRLKDPAVLDITQNLAGFQHNLAVGRTGITTEEGFDQHINDVNEKHRLATGSVLPMINNAEREHLRLQWYAGQEHAAKQLAALSKQQLAKDEAYRVTSQVVLDAANSGNPATLKGMPLDPMARTDTLNKWFQTGYGGTEQNPEARAIFFQKAAKVSWEESMRIPAMEQMLKVGLGGLMSAGGEVTPAQLQAFGVFKGLLATENGPQAVAAYVGSDMAAKVTGLVASGADPSNPKQFLDQVQRINAGGAATADEAEKKAAKAAIKSADPGWFRSLNPWADKSLSPYEMSDGAKEFLAERVSGRAAQLARASQIPIDQAARMVVEEETQNADLLGGSMILRNPMVPGDKSLHAAVNRLRPNSAQSDELYQTAAVSLIHERVVAINKAKGADMTNVHPEDYHVAGGTQIGGGVVQITLLPKDATRAVQLGPTQVLIRPQELADRIDRTEREHAEALKAKRAKVQRDSTGENPFGGFR